MSSTTMSMPFNQDCLDVIYVPSDLSPRTGIKAFVEGRGLTYNHDTVFCQLTEPATVFGSAQIVAENITTGNFISGSAVPLALGLPVRKTSLMLEPEMQKDFRIFVQSSSPDATLVPGIAIVVDRSVHKPACHTPRKRTAKKAGLSVDGENRPKRARRFSKRLSAARAEMTQPAMVTKRVTRSMTRDKGSSAPKRDTKPVMSKSKKAPAAALKKTVSVPRKVLSPGARPDGFSTKGSQVVFSFDTTGSMASCLQKVKDDIQLTVPRLLSTAPDLSIAIIAHGDYCDADSSYVIKQLDFTRDSKKICDFVRGCGPTCGGDFDECYELVLHDARKKLSWREGAAKSVVLIGDATPHEPDYFLNVKNIDWKHECDELRKAHIKVYAVRCLYWDDCDAFYKEVARRTAGHYLELHQLQAVADFLVAISLSAGAGGKDSLLTQFRDEVQSRHGGMLTRNMRKLFSTLRENGEDEEEEELPEADLEAVEPARFQLLDVPSRMGIKEFVERSHAVFMPGKAFYEFTKPEIISDRKEIVLLDKTTGDMFTGSCARERAGIPPADGTKRRIKPPASDRWVLFVQSTSFNRVLVGGTRFLYEIA